MSKQFRRDKSVPDMPSKAVVSRLSLYLREVQRLVGEGQETISSTRLGSKLGITDAQVRKDFANFGQFGYPGRGYKCQELVGRLKQILGTDRIWPVALVGCGHLGQAIIGYGGFRKRGFELAAAFDTSADLIGKKIGAVTINDFSDFAQQIDAKQIELAILAVPAGVAQEIAHSIVQAGITGILSFAPVAFDLPQNVAVTTVDLAVELEQLSFAVVRSRENG